MGIPRSRRLLRLVAGVVFVALGVLGIVLGIEQLRGVALSDAIQRHGVLAIASTIGVRATGAHGGAELEVRFVTTSGRQERRHPAAQHARRALPP